MAVGGGFNNTGSSTEHDTKQSFLLNTNVYILRIVNKLH